ncbi:nicotinate (nicotinamide) nucleotide adenylyltransferase [Ruminococcaceae bacterium OttesenSCG-928-I18]|nr:nicotinate (nicotinamide) nucleotide adenylyltransferase [Ruminococcaceae bacterium OttesenSCG-928-I18]
MKTLLFGGTFDPPHRGHVQLLRHAISAVHPERVVVIPAGVPPHKEAAATPPGLRYAMCACFAPVFEGLVVSDMEITRPGKSYTLDTVRALKKQYPGDDFYLSVGGDMVLSFTSWYHYRELLLEVSLVIQSRQEEEQALKTAVERLVAEGARVLWAKGETQAISSSAIREGIAEGKDLYSQIPPPADRIARENGLYQKRTNEQTDRR